MLKQFSHYSPYIENINNNLDRTCVKWTEQYIGDKSTIPYAANINGKKILLNNFNSTASQCVMIDIDSFYNAIYISIQLYSNQPISFREWIALNNLAKKIDTPLADILPIKVPYKDPNTFISILNNACKLDDTIIDYISQKNISYKVVELLLMLNNSQISYTSSYIREVTPTVQQFKIFIETVRDFSNKITDEQFNKDTFNNLTNRLSPLHTKLKEEIGNVKSIIKNSDFNTKNNFETNDFILTINIQSVKDFESCIDNMITAKNHIDRIYKLLECNK